MNPAAKIMCLRQGDRPIEEYVRDFIELAPLAFFDEVCLMIFFRGGLSEPISSLMPLHHPGWNLQKYIIQALLLAESRQAAEESEVGINNPRSVTVQQTQGKHSEIVRQGNAIVTGADLG